MSRRRRRERPATPAEQQQIEQIAALADVALTAPSMADRRRALNRMRRITDRLADPGKLTGLPPAELHDALTERCVDTPKQVRKP
ncbi:hypothetical protein CSH63_29310 [Micromonospora tulbaghiae]|uniref:Uncharacterized protein n=1 Tax=Micromonospora tulbaghiae TaxID=479978 RepID=A0A386WU10_9ACTN|nr:hypothetical protein [Micromonospora tulbaghiae]AYF31473.1 hypothetical protein CSH63_29310 [Micromonospora tulbaghiae]